YYHLAGASEPASYTWTLRSKVVSSGGIARYSGADGAHPLDVAASTGSGSASSATMAGLSTVTPGAMLVGCAAINSASPSATITGPASMGEVWDIAGSRQELDDEVRSTAGSTGSRTWTFNASRRWAGWLAALRPAVPTPTPTPTPT